MSCSSPGVQIDRANRSVTIEVRVRYPECDPAGLAHHSVFAVWLEIARTELLRQQGVPYAELARSGVLFVVAKMSIRYRRPVYYDDVLEVRTWVRGEGRAKVEHEYELCRRGLVVATAETTLVCVDRDGRPQPIPDDVVTG